MGTRPVKHHDKYARPALKHSLGQNFILDSVLQEELAGLTGLGKDDQVLEIGAGSGMFTAALAQRVGQLTAVELDAEMIPYLKAAVLQYPNVTVIQQDILKMDWKAYAETHGPFHIAANLPYHVTTALLTQIMGQTLPIESIHLMLQRESAEKLCAEPGDEGYGPMTLIVAWRYTAEIRKYVPREAFTPAPRVDSAFISLVRRDQPPCRVNDENLMFGLIQAGFAHRRKTLLNNLMNRYQLPREAIIRWLGLAHIPADARAEQVSLREWVSLADAYTDPAIC